MNRHYNLWVISNTPQAITLTIRDFVAQRCSLQNLFLSTLNDVGKRLSRCCHKWVLYPELTPDRGQLHFHGTIFVKDPIKWMHFVNYYNKVYGFLKLKPVDDICAWSRYIEKDWFTMQQLLKLQTKMYEFDDKITSNSYLRFIGGAGAPAPKIST